MTLQQNKIFQILSGKSKPKTKVAFMALIFMLLMLITEFREDSGDKQIVLHRASAPLWTEFYVQTGMFKNKGSAFQDIQKETTILMSCHACIINQKAHLKKNTNMSGCNLTCRCTKSSRPLIELEDSW